MEQAAENFRNQHDQAAIDAVNEMLAVMCPHKMQQEFDDLLKDIVLEHPDFWDENRAEAFRALRELTEELCEAMPPQVIRLQAN